MKNIYTAFLLILLFTTDSCSQVKSVESLSKFLNGFKTYSLPIVISNTISEIENDNIINKLSKDDYINYLGNSNYPSYVQMGYFLEKFIKYEHNGVLFLVYKVEYENNDLAREKTEFYLCAFSKGKSLDRILIQGSHGDDLNFFGKIDSNNIITVIQEIFSTDKIEPDRKMVKYSFSRDDNKFIIFSN